jgi:DNA-binding XRE family transcriptional regulator
MCTANKYRRAMDTSTSMEEALPLRPKGHSFRAKGNYELPVYYFVLQNRTYVIPKVVAEQYLVTEEDEGSIPAEVFTAELFAKYTKAGALLRGLRYREDLKQVEFAKKINVTQASLSKMENGKRPIGKNIAKRIQKVFGVDYKYFLE